MLPFLEQLTEIATFLPWAIGGVAGSVLVFELAEGAYEFITGRQLLSLCIRRRHLTDTTQVVVEIPQPVVVGATSVYDPYDAVESASGQAPALNRQTNRFIAALNLN